MASVTDITIAQYPWICGTLLESLFKLPALQKYSIVNCNYSDAGMVNAALGVACASALRVLTLVRVYRNAQHLRQLNGDPDLTVGDETAAAVGTVFSLLWVLAVLDQNTISPVGVDAIDQDCPFRG